MKKITFPFILLLVNYICLFSQFTLSGEFRPRTEYSHGYATLAPVEQDASLFTSQRTRLNLTYTEDLLHTKLVLQDVRTWGNQPQLVGNESNATSVHEAWAEFALVKNLWLKTGRMELVYDNHRIFGNVGWAQQARSHDLALLKYEGNIKAHLGLAINQNTNRTNNFYGGPNLYKNMQFIWLNKSFENLNISVLFLNNGIHNTVRDSIGAITNEEIRYSQNVGFYESYKSGKLGIYSSFYYQTGKDAGNRELSAYQLNAEVSYKAIEEFTITGGYELLSGTAFDETENNNSFTPFYGTNHKFNGFMDYFYVGNHMNSFGLSDIYLKGAYKKEKVTLQGFAHIFGTAAKMGNGLGNNLGTEIDLVCGYILSETVTINLGYSQMLPTGSMESLKGGNKNKIQNWAWLMITVNPVFFKSNK